jgi:hypothetical protein
MYVRHKQRYSGASRRSPTLYKNALILLRVHAYSSITPRLHRLLGSEGIPPNWSRLNRRRSACKPSRLVRKFRLQRQRHVGSLCIGHQLTHQPVIIIPTLLHTEKAARHANLAVQIALGTSSSAAFHPAQALPFILGLLSESLLARRSTP